MSSHDSEIKKGERFEFGDNWQAFLSSLNDERINQAQTSLADMLKTNDLTGMTFLDIGSGSGLFSLVAKKMGASVRSFDYDPASVACTRELKQRYFRDDESWIIEQGSALDAEYLKSLGKFDIVYSWGVLHHTGSMALALENAALPVADDGSLYIAIYNYQNIITNFWTRVKRLYCSSKLGKGIVLAVFIPVFILQSILLGIIKYRNPIGNFVNYKEKRGMSIYYDWFDWLGGYPFEAAKPEDIFQFYQQRGFEMSNFTTVNGHGCNQFLFRNTDKTVSL